jgi:hypothetical protein
MSVHRGSLYDEGMAANLRALSAVFLALATAVAAASCGSGSGASAGPRDAAFPETSTGDATVPAASMDGASDAPVQAVLAGPLGDPITAAAGTWTWVDFPDSTCDDGTPTGIGVYRNTGSDKLLVFFNGGGACWDYATCVTLNTSTHGPFGASQFAALSSGAAGTIVDVASSLNPFNGYSAVFIPYCTGDLHAGNAVATYTGDGGSRVIHHEGHANVLAYLARLAATFKTPGQIVVSGSSAGGGGALFNYATFRAYWPSTPMMLIDDSLPLFEGDAIPQAFRAAWYQNWNLGVLTDPICGAGCRSDLSLFMSAIAKQYPADRMALLSSEQDATISQYFLLDGTAFQADLTALAADVLAPLHGFNHFFVTGNSHTMLGTPVKFTAGGTPLLTWLSRMATADPAWASTMP